ncbi:putative PepX_C domain-containing protein [Mesorhizobium escarrei]|uniref:PepX_C domain-containing protein n=2 Tax=Mesorhizobium escarrei TaxID=666018 RepID=A0ABN8JK56_9HYPH|nr:putative PepX_C domain-containing protein [Mesorhizobium escarrei]
MFMPEVGGPCPAVVEYNPYRRHDITRARDGVVHRYFAQRGYVSIRLEISGTGDSDGLLTDEYCDREIDDLEEAIDYIGRQPWCSGGVGVLGHSWGAFSALLVAQRRPPRLKAIIPVMGSDDRYRECIHYNDGCLLASNLVWASFMQLYSALPPNPDVVGETWLSTWRSRLAAQPLWASQWMRHDRFDPYWRQGSVAPDYGLIDCPIYVFAGTADRYRDAGFRLLENCTTFVKLTMGPWDHCYPHEAAYRPIDFLAEAVRWWDRWLKGIDTGVEREARTAVWMSGSAGQGYWVTPPAGTIRETLSLTADRPAGVAALKPLLDTDWVVLPESACGELSSADNYVQFWAAPAAKAMNLFGIPELALRCDQDAAAGQLVARLYEVVPGRNATEIARGSSRPSGPTAPGVTERRISFHTVAWRLQAGSRLCVVVSDGLWPAIAPVPGETFRGQDLSDVRLTLSIGGDQMAHFEPFASVSDRLPADIVVLSPPQTKIVSHESPGTGERMVQISSHAGIFGEYTRAFLPDIVTEIEHRVTKEFRLSHRSASTSTVGHDFRLERDGWAIGLQGSFSLTSGTAGLQLRGDIRAFVSGSEIFRKQWPDEVIVPEGQGNVQRRRVMQEAEPQ